MEIDKNIAARLVAIRQEKGYTQAEFAQMLKIGRSTVTNWENGTTPLIEKNIKMICFTFNVNETWLRAGIGEMFIDVPQGLKTDEEKKLVDMFQKLLPEMQAIILQKVREMVNLQEGSWLPPESGPKDKN